MKVLLLLPFILLTTHAHASGCLGGDWQTLDKKTLAPVEIRTDRYGMPVSEVSIYDNSGYVTWKYAGTATEVLTFYSGTFDLAKIDLTDLLKKLAALQPVVVASAQMTVETNPYYDDCEDIPENTKRSTTEFTFSVHLENGQSQAFSATSVTYDPPLKK